jgi:hypothetical protein
MAPWHLRVSKAPSAVTVAISCPGGIRPGWSASMGVAHVAGGEPGRPQFQRLLIDPDLDPAPVEPWFRH